MIDLFIRLISYLSTIDKHKLYKGLFCVIEYYITRNKNVINVTGHLYLWNVFLSLGTGTLHIISSQYSLTAVS